MTSYVLYAYDDENQWLACQTATGIIRLQPISEQMEEVASWSDRSRAALTIENFRELPDFPEDIVIDVINVAEIGTVVARKSSNLINNLKE